MSKINDGGPAFPTPEIRAPDGTGIQEGALGMSLRDWIMGQALVGLLASGQWNNSTVQGGFADHIASQAGEIADAAIAERERQP